MGEVKCLDTVVLINRHWAIMILSENSFNESSLHKKANIAFVL